jgi:hypothetical protein
VLLDLDLPWPAEMFEKLLANRYLSSLVTAGVNYTVLLSNTFAN